jgi:SAM-dependent methyltransferase
LSAASIVPIIAQSQFFDVPFVPTPQVVVDEMLRLAAVTPNDVVYDLGSGDGRIVITAARKFGARAIGVELDEHLIYQSEESARQANVLERVKFVQQDFFKTDFSQASVITMYLLPGVMKRLRERMLQLKPGTRLVAHDFDFDDWRPDVKTTIRKNVFLWIVPAQAAGRWQVRAGLPGGDFVFDMELRQKYQELDGFVRID